MMWIDATDLPSILRRIRGNVGILLSATGIATALGFATVMLNARALGAEGLGIIALVQASAAILIGLFNIGSQQPMIRLGRQAIEDGQTERVGIIAGLAVLLDTGMAVLAGLCALLLIWLVPGLIDLSSEMAHLALIYTIVVFLSGTAAAIGLLRLLNRFRYIAVIQVINALLILAAAGALFLTGAGVGAYILAYAVIHSGTAVAHVVLALLLLRGNDIPICFSPREIWQAGILREYFNYAWTTSATSTLDTVRLNADALLLGAFFGPAAVGIYSVVKQLTGAFNKLITPISSAIFPEVSGLAARGDRAGARKLLNRIAVLGLAIGSGGLLVMILAGGAVLEFGFGKEFEDGYLALVVMMCAVSLSLSGVSFGGFVQVFHSPKKFLYVIIGAFIVYVLTAPLLIYFMGVVGAAVGQIVFALTRWIGCWRTLASVLPPSYGTSMASADPTATGPESLRVQRSWWSPAFMMKRLWDEKEGRP